MNQTFMKERPIVPLVLTMSLPMVLSMLVNALYNIIDSYFVAKISEDAMTALSLVFPIQNIIGAVSIGFGVGVNAAVAFYLGAQEDKKATQAGSLGILLGILLSTGNLNPKQHQHGRQQRQDGVKLHNTAKDQSFCPIIRLLG